MLTKISYIQMVVICVLFIIFAYRITAYCSGEESDLIVVICVLFIIFAYRITADDEEDSTVFWL